MSKEEEFKLKSIYNLVNRGINATDENDNTALILAAYSGYTRIGKKSIAAGADLDKQNVFGNTALISASWCGYTEIGKTLIEAGADLNKQNEDGKTALDFAEDELKEIIIQAGEHKLKNPKFQAAKNELRNTILEQIEAAGKNKISKLSS